MRKQSILTIEETLMEIRFNLLMARNQFNNCLNDDLLDVLISEINALEKKEDYYIRQMKELTLA